MSEQQQSVSNGTSIEAVEIEMSSTLELNQRETCQKRGNDRRRAAKCDF
jgi:hypothetical protein